MSLIPFLGIYYLMIGQGFVIVEGFPGLLLGSSGKEKLIFICENKDYIK